jgi:hypothetical protein
MKANFSDKGIPVIIGKFSASYRSDLTDKAEFAKHVQSRNHFYNLVSKTAFAKGLVPVVWDNGDLKPLGCGLMDRPNLKVAYQDAVNALILGSQGKDLPK